jgi:hypothetical protein
MSTKLTDSQNAMLLAAALREDRCLAASPTLKGSAARKVAVKLIAEGLVNEVKAKGEAPVWRHDPESGHAYALKLTAVGVKIVASLGHKAVAGSSETAPIESIPEPSDTSISIAPVDAIGKTAPREGSKLASVMAMLRRPEGATILALTDATGWLPHTTRAALTGVRKRGYAVVLERSKEGESVYRLSDPETETVRVVGVAQESDVIPRRKAAAKRAA